MMTILTEFGTCKGRVADQPDGARKQPVMKRRVPRKLRRVASGQAGQTWVMPPSTTSSTPVI
jgi:hypothetical protein